MIVARVSTARTPHRVFIHQSGNRHSKDRFTSTSTLGTRHESFPSEVQSVRLLGDHDSHRARVEIQTLGWVNGLRRGDLRRRQHVDGSGGECIGGTGHRGRHRSGARIHNRPRRHHYRNDDEPSATRAKTFIYNLPRIRIAWNTHPLGWFLKLETEQVCVGARSPPSDIIPSRRAAQRATGTDSSQPHEMRTIDRLTGRPSRVRRFCMFGNTSRRSIVLLPQFWYFSLANKAANKSPFGPGYLRASEDILP